MDMVHIKRQCEDSMTEADKKEIIDKCCSVERPGLYIMVCLCLLMNSCHSEASRLRRIEERLERIENAITNTPNICTGLTSSARPENKEDGK
jgi:hypothetical protein